MIPILLAVVLLVVAAVVAMQKTVYSIVANDTTVGTTIGTFDPINSRNGDVALTGGNPGTNVICGIAVGASRVAQTTATAMLARLRMSSPGAQVAAGSFDVALGYSTGGGIATQSGGFGSPVEFIPVDLPAHSNDVVNYFLSQAGIEPADNWAIEVATLHGQRPPAWWYQFAGGQGYAPIAGAVSSNGGSTTTARTSLTSVTIPGYLKTIVGYRAVQAEDAVQTTAEPQVAYTDLQTTVTGVTPQEYPTDSVNPALAGTLVGLGLWDWTPVIPCYWSKGTGTETVEPFVTGAFTTSAANAFVYGFLLRRD